MNRIIKFRCWDKIAKQMRIGQSCLDLLYLEGDKNVILQQFTGLLDKNGKEIYEGDIVKHSYIPEYIYASNDPDCHYPIFTGKFEYNEQGVVGFGFSCFCIYTNLEALKKQTMGSALVSYHKVEHCKSEESGEIEVIGNIFENPDLLK